MLMTAIVLNLIVALGVCLLAAKYLFGPAPATYHASILSGGGHDIDATVSAVFGAINKGLGGALFALALAVALMTFFGVAQDLLWAKVTIMVAALAAALPAIPAMRRVEARSGVRTPWRPALGLGAVAALAFVISLL